MDWIKCKDRLPQISYIESDGLHDMYKAFPILVFSKEKPGNCCVAYLEKEQDENMWSFGDLSWKIYIPGENGDIIDVDFDEFTHWMELPEKPNVSVGR